jgi:TfoX/Sxy family transcriptional regulator of competence genes
MVLEQEQELATHVRAALAGAGTLREVKMFGGIGFMLNGNLIAGASRRGLLVRVGKERKARGARPPRGASDGDERPIKRSRRRAR